MVPLLFIKLVSNIMPLSYQSFSKTDFHFLFIVITYGQGGPGPSVEQVVEALLGVAGKDPSWTAGESWAPLGAGGDWSDHNDVQIQVDALTHCITDYIHFCVDNTLPTKKVQCFFNNKPWVTPELKLKEKKRVPFWLHNILMCSQNGRRNNFQALKKQAFRLRSRGFWSSPWSDHWGPQRPGGLGQ